MRQQQGAWEFKSLMSSINPFNTCPKLLAKHARSIQSDIASIEDKDSSARFRTMWEILTTELEKPECKASDIEKEIKTLQNDIAEALKKERNARYNKALALNSALDTDLDKFLKPDYEFLVSTNNNNSKTSDKQTIVKNIMGSTEDISYDTFKSKIIDTLSPLLGNDTYAGRYAESDIKFDIDKLRNPDQYGGLKRTKAKIQTPKGLRVIHTGPRGGKYVRVNGKLVSASRYI